MQIVTNQFQKEIKKHGNDDFPILVSREQLSRYPSGSFLWHWHPEIEITLITEGEMLYKINQCSFILKKGEALFGNSNVLHGGFMQDFKDCQYVSITFDPKLIYGFHQSALYRKYVEPLIQDFSRPAIHFDRTKAWHGKVIEKIEKIISLIEGKQDFFELDTVIELQSVWREILANNEGYCKIQAHDRVEHQRIREIIDYLEHNFDRKILLREVAEHIHLCESECSRLFHRYMNVSLFTFLQEYRVERSLEYLMNPEYSITEIAGKTGFTDSNYYSKVFSKIKGCSPMQYRKRRRS